MYTKLHYDSEIIIIIKIVTIRYAWRNLKSSLQILFILSSNVGVTILTMHVLIFQIVADKQTTFIS